VGYDAIARGLAVRSLQRQPAGIEQFGGDASPGASPTRNTAAFRDALASGVSKVVLAGARYPVAALAQTEQVRLRRSGQQPALLLPGWLRLLDGQGATLALGNSLGILAAPYASYAFPEVRSDLAADVAAGATTLTLAAGEGAKWNAGDTFLYRLGSLPYDLPEPLQWGFRSVRSVAGDVLTIDAPMPGSFALSSVAGATFTDEFGVAARRNRTLHKWPLVTDLTVRDLAISGDAAGVTEVGLQVQGGRRVTLSGVTASRVGCGFLLQYVDGGLIDGCAMADSSTPGNPSLNKGISLAEARAIDIRHFTCSGVMQAVAAEAGSEATISGGRFDNTGNPADGSGYGVQCIVFSAQGRSQLTVRDFTVTGHGGYVLAENANGQPGFEGRIRFEGRLTLEHPAMPASLGPLADMNCLLDLRIAGGRELWDFAGARWFTRRVWLRNGQYQSIGLPPGILRQARVHASSGVVPGTNLTDLYIGRTNDNGSSHIARLVAGQTVTLSGVGDSGAILTRRSEQVKLLVITASGTALDTGSEFIDVHCEIVPDLLAPAFAWTSEEDARELGPGGGIREALFAAYDLPSIGAGATLQRDLAISPMATGDLVESVSLGIDRTGIVLRDVQALPGQCRILLENRTGAAIDLPPADVRILWRKPLRN